MKAGFSYHQICILPFVLITIILDYPESQAVPIVGGRFVSTEGNGHTKYPFIVSLQDFAIEHGTNGTKKYSFQHFCGGSLISNRWILTAAHCVWRKKIEKIVAFIGYENIENVESLERYHVESAKFIYFHPSNYRNDIALLYLSRPFKSQLAKDLQFAQLPPPGMKPNINACRIIGYGATKHAGPSQKRLSEAELSIIDNKQCRDIIGHIWAPKNGDNTVCALGNNSQDSCQGDSGGPLMCTYGSEDRLRIYGLVSHGLTCGIKGMPSIYTVTKPYDDWIQLHLQKA